MIFDLPRVEDTELFTWLRQLVEQIELGTMDDEKIRKITGAIDGLAGEIKALRTAVEELQAASFPFIRDEITNLNNIETIGIYYATEVSSNAPDSDSSWMVIHVQNASGETKKQLALNVSGLGLYERGYYTNNIGQGMWSAWFEIGG